VAFIYKPIANLQRNRAQIALTLAIFAENKEKEDEKRERRKRQGEGPARSTTPPRSDRHRGLQESHLSIERSGERAGEEEGLITAFRDKDGEGIEIRRAPIKRQR